MTRPSGPARAKAVTELRDGYLVRNPALRLLLRVVDRLHPPADDAPAAALPAAPRVLLASNGHLGDVVILTALLRAVRRRIPDSRVGILVPSWSRPVLARDPSVEWIHVVDHWKNNRAPTSLVARWRRYQSTRREGLEAIRAVSYDFAIDTTAYFPNFARLLADARIPIRAGFTSGGFAGLLSHPVSWRDDGRHVAERQLDLLDAVVPSSSHNGVVRYALPAPGAEAAARVAALLRGRRVAAEHYVVVHMGAGDARKHWRPDAWRTVVRAITDTGTTVVLTGRGPEEAAMNRAVTAALPGVVDLADQATWDEFVVLVEGARLVVTVDTAAGHVAAATRTPCVVVWNATARPELWRPFGDDVEVVLPHGSSPDAQPRPRGNALSAAVGDVLAAVMRRLDVVREAEAAMPDAMPGPLARNA